jgi:hypothetical protein
MAMTKPFAIAHLLGSGTRGSHSGQSLDFERRSKPSTALA